MRMNDFISSSRLLELIITINKQISSSSETQDEHNRELLRALGCLESRILVMENDIQGKNNNLILRQELYELENKMLSLESRITTLHNIIIDSESRLLGIIGSIDNRLKLVEGALKKYAEEK